MGSKKNEKSKFESVLPKMSARSGLVGNKSSRPYLGPSEAIFVHGPEKIKTYKKLPISLGGPMGPIHPVWGHVLVSCHKASVDPSWDSRLEQGVHALAWWFASHTYGPTKGG